jgi:thymidylate synthase
MKQTVDDIRYQLSNALSREEFVTDKSGVKTIEIVGASFVADEEVIFGKPVDGWSEREIKWYESMSLNVWDIPAPVPVIWQKVSDKDGKINSNYGWCIWSEDNGHQYDNTLAELRKNPESRRAIMIYNRPSMWLDYNSFGKSDFMCTNAVQYMIRDGQLNAVVQMRSNDLIFGYKGDRHWQMYVLHKLAGELGVPPGEITWQVGSAHIYERHFYLVDNWLMTNELSCTMEEYEKRVGVNV